MNKNYRKFIFQAFLLALVFLSTGFTHLANAGVIRTTADVLTVAGTSTKAVIHAVKPAETAVITYKAGGAITGYSGQGWAIIQRPSGIDIGDTMFVNISTAGPGDSYTAPIGWTLVSDGTRTADSSTIITTRLYSKVLTSSDTTSYSWRVGPAQGYSASLLAFAGVGQTDSVATSSILMAKLPPLLTVSTTRAGSALLYFWVNNDQGSIGTAPAGMTFPAAIATGGVGVSAATGFAAYQTGVTLGLHNLQGSMTGSTRVAAFAVVVSAATATSPQIPGSVALSASSYAVAQSGGSLLVSVSRSGGSGGAVSVAYGTVDGSAIAGQDYSATSGTLAWASGDTAAKAFSVPISNAFPYLGTKAFSINLSNAGGGATLGAVSSATATITGSALTLRGTLALLSANFTVSQTAGGLSVTVNRSGGLVGAVSVAYSTSNGTAFSGTDYTATSGTLNWSAADSLAKSFAIPISNASPFFGSKVFNLTLSNAVGGALLGTPNTAVVMINGSSVASPGSIALSSASYAVAQSLGVLPVTVNRIGGSGGAVSVAYSTSNGTALSGTDYNGISGTLTWAAGDSASKIVTVSISNTFGFDGSKTFGITLSNLAGGAAFGTPSSATVTINGSGAVPPSADAIGAVAAARLLTQGTFGPSISGIDGVALQSYDQWFAGQVAAVPSLVLPSVSSNDTNWIPFWWRNIVQGPDQLRQRMAWALSQIMVVSGQTGALNFNNPAAASYYDLLTTNAFSNFRTLLERVTLSPEMGLMLNMFRNNKQDATTGVHADQNFAREVMQLFTIGLVQLNPDGTPRLDSSGKTIPTYGSSEIENLSNVLTGWASYSSAGDTEQGWQYALDYLNPMIAYAAHHDTSAKTIVGGAVVPAGGTAAADLKIALDTLFNHPNVGPFFGKQLIQRLVTSNPSPAYVTRVAAVFNNNGVGVRGDLLAVLRAILTDPEAVTPGTNAATGGKLREPLLKLSHLWRAFSAVDSSGGNNEYAIVQNAYDMSGEAPLSAATVFNFYQPNYVRSGALASAGLTAPEFQILNENTLVLIANQFQTQAYQFVDSAGQGHQGFQGYDEITGGVVLRTAAWESYANDPATLIDKFNQVFLLGQMSSAMRSSLIAYVGGIPTTDTSWRGRRVVEAADLILNSPQYSIQH